ncbi:hypothetical protein IPJ72_01680 [Candidatus Peregrinibacteria bacterium]|nr:MAG: hypothetical protein IPJ72_01680 [Candidatus Peregrinibacteria bacterium]
MIQTLKKTCGYTLVELTIVVIIIGMIFGLGIQMYQKERLSFIINQQLSSVVLLIKEARNLAISSEPFFVNNAIGSITPADGYGIYFNMAPSATEPHVILFANVDGNQNSIYDDDPETYDANDVAIKTIRFHPDIVPEWFYFNALSDTPDLGYVEQSVAGPPKAINGEQKAVIIFRPPLATPTITNNGSTHLAGLRIKYLNQNLESTSARRCPRIDIDHIRAFATLEYDQNCP